MGIASNWLGSKTKQGHASCQATMPRILLVVVQLAFAPILLAMHSQAKAGLASESSQ